MSNFHSDINLYKPISETILYVEELTVTYSKKVFLIKINCIKQTSVYSSYKDRVNLSALNILKF